MSDARKSIFVIRFADDGEFLPVGWLQKNEVDAAFQVRTWKKDRPIDVTKFEVHGLACLMKGSWSGDEFFARWHKDLERREAEARAEQRAKKLA
jgi:hypothetical protein